MERLQCGQPDPTSIVKHEFNPDEFTLLDERIIVKQELLRDDSQCVDKTDSLHGNAVMKVECVSEEIDVHVVVKEEVNIENFNCDIFEKSTPSDSNTVNVIIIQGDMCYRTHETKLHKSGLSEADSGLSQGDKYFSDLNVFSKEKMQTGISKYQCDICGKAFTFKSYLSNHKLIHNGVKNHKCSVCGKAFIRSIALSRHKIIHSVVKNYRFCSYQCNVCNKPFNRKHTLSNHMSIHSDIKTNQCDVSNKTFTSKSILSNHKLTHSSVKNF